MTVNCPKCDADISETYEPDDYSCGVISGWYCDACDLGIGEHEVEREPQPDDVPITFRREPGEPLGTPISELSGQPGTPGYEKFKRIAKSWGHD
jgi:hypothetical protein